MWSVRPDVLIVGGGVMGCATAAFLRGQDAAASVTAYTVAILDDWTGFPAGDGVQAGVVTWDRPLPARTTATTYFDTVVWPALAHRLPALDRLRLKASWTGDYDVNHLDRNMIIGNWPGHLDNFYVACGFSGHGLMHAPAVGRALSELILHREFRAIDLGRLGYHRVLAEESYAEEGIV